ncbi:hypothetical protein MC885_008051 [Smutsia gigantea]|nr:hypothetical protein MC885_008051 [Smutsia gigantea]
MCAGKLALHRVRWPAPHLVLCPQPAAPAELGGGGRVCTFLSLSQAAQPDTWGQDYRSHHACEAGGRRGTEG